MSTTAATVPDSPLERWTHRARLLIATLIVWFVTAQLAGPLVWGHPHRAPLTLFVGHAFAGGAVVVTAVLVSAALAASVVRGEACLTLLAAAIRTRRLDRSLLSPAALDPHGELRTSGPMTLVTVVAVAAVVVPILTGPQIGWTRHGQVYFALVAGFFVATLAGRRIGRARGLVWYAAAPFVVGLIGVVWAMLRPSPGGAYARLDVVPAHGLVRPLPVEMIGTSLATIGWTLYSRRRRESP